MDEESWFGVVGKPAARRCLSTSMLASIRRVLSSGPGRIVGAGGDVSSAPLLPMKRVTSVILRCSPPISSQGTQMLYEGPAPESLK